MALQTDLAVGLPNDPSGWIPIASATVFTCTFASTDASAKIVIPLAITLASASESDPVSTATIAALPGRLSFINSAGRLLEIMAAGTNTPGVADRMPLIFQS